MGSNIAEEFIGVHFLISRGRTGPVNRSGIRHSTRSAAADPLRLRVLLRSELTYEITWPNGILHLRLPCLTEPVAEFGDLDRQVGEELSMVAPTTVVRLAFRRAKIATNLI